MKASDPYRRLLGLRGIELREMHIDDIALTREDALHAVDLLRADSVPILGEDVDFREGSRIRHAYANWSIQRLRREDDRAYGERSWAETAQYVRDFRGPTDIEALFSFTVAR